MGIKLDGIAKKHLISAKTLLSDRSLSVHNGIIRVYRIEKDEAEPQRYVLTITYTTPSKIRREKVLAKSNHLNKIEKMSQNFLGKTICLQDPYRTAEEIAEENAQDLVKTNNDDNDGLIKL